MDEEILSKNKMRRSIPEYKKPFFIRMILKTDSEAYSILSFMQYASNRIKSTDRVLDAGAGSRPYLRFFDHALYESTDFEDIFDKSAINQHDFICSLDDIPRPDNSYDAIINTQVLEHVEHPQKVVNELFRILKPNGSLFFTAPQGWGIHGAPYHFFNFTKYGLESLFKNADFKIVFIKPRGGIFRYLAKRIRTLPDYVFSQHMSRHPQKFNQALKTLVLLPAYLPSVLLCRYIVPFLLFHLDGLDLKKDYTLGYSCHCIKPEVTES